MSYNLNSSTVRAKILELKNLGRMPNESVNDTESIVEVVKQYDELLADITPPLDTDEVEVLIGLFPESGFYDLQWDLLSLVESAILTDVDYKKLIDACPSDEWREILNARFSNWLKSQKQNF